MFVCNAVAPVMNGEPCACAKTRSGVPHMSAASANGRDGYRK
jgi:hypothetical protein